MNATLPANTQEASLGEILAHCLAERVEMTELEAMQCAGLHLARRIAHNSNAEFENVWREMTHLPDGLLKLLDSREGWHALSAVVCGALDVPTASVIPVVH
jgi:hypothetical protein